MLGILSVLRAILDQLEAIATSLETVATANTTIATNTTPADEPARNYSIIIGRNVIKNVG